MKRIMIRTVVLACLLAAGIAPFALAGETASEKETQLLAQRREVELAMHKLRLETIKKDPEINRLHEKIMAMHKELQLKIDSTPDMQKLIKRAEQLDRDLRRYDSGKK